MYEDSPEELVHDLLSETVWGGVPSGNRYWDKSSLRNINRQMIAEYMDERYNQPNTVIAVAGNFDESRLEALLEKYFGAWAPKNGKAQEFQHVEFRPEKGIKKGYGAGPYLPGFDGIKYGMTTYIRFSPSTTFSAAE